MAKRPSVEPRFSESIGGYDPDAVRQATSVAIEALASCLEEVDELRTRLAQIQGGTAAGEEQAAMEVIHGAAAAAHVRAADARRQAARIIYAAEEQAQTLVRALELDRDALAHQLSAARLRHAWALRVLEALVADRPAPERHEGADEVPTGSLAEADLVAQLLGRAIAASGREHGAVPSSASPVQDDSELARTEPAARESGAGASWIGPRLRMLGAAAAVVLTIGATATIGGGVKIPARSPVVAAGISGVPVAGAFLPERIADGQTAPAEAPVPEAAATGGARAESQQHWPIMLRIETSRECWVRTIVDGRPEERVLPPGATLLRGGRETIAVRIGDAGAVRLTLNGTVLPPLGRDGQVVGRRFTASGAGR